MSIFVSLTDKIQQKVLALVGYIGRLGDNPADTAEIQMHKAIQLNTILLGGIPVQITLGFLMLSIEQLTAAIITFLLGFLSLCGVAYFVWTKQHYPFFRFTQLLIPLLSPFAVTLVLGGIEKAGFSIMWGMVAPMLALILYSMRQAFYWFLAFLGVVAVSGFAQPYLTGTGLSPDILVITAVVNIVSIASMVFAALAFFVHQRALAFRLLDIERNKAETLLVNILPQEIATILKDSDQIIAEQFDHTTILFADIVNFTPLSSTMSPTALVELLNELFSHFDTLVEKYGVEKIKTIGDCYMVAAGVPRPHRQHAHSLVNLALDMRDYVNKNQFNGHALTFRMGLNSGPVVAGVIGRKKFIYDLWGDAVNTASRMESHSVGGSIQVTESTYELIKDSFVCEAQGEIYVKGKGAMPVWHVRERNPVPSPV